MYNWFQWSLENNVYLFIFLSRLTKSGSKIWYYKERCSWEQLIWLSWRRLYLDHLRFFHLLFNAFCVASDALSKMKIINDKVTMVFMHICLRSRKWSVTYWKQKIKFLALCLSLYGEVQGNCHANIFMFVKL